MCGQLATKLGRSRSTLYPYRHLRAIHEPLHDHPPRRHRRPRHFPDRPPSAWARAQEAGSSVQEFTAAPSKLRLRPDAGAEVEAWAFNGSLAPVVRIKQGAELRLRLRNDTALPLSLHFHGVRGPNAMDGVGGLTQEPVAPGGSHEYRFTPVDSGTFLIRPCVLGGSAEPQERGLSGLLIVEETNPPPVDQDLALLVDDWRLSDDGSLTPFEKAAEAAPAGRLGSWLSVNGKATPQRIEAPPGGRLRLRLANACNARAMRLRFDGLKAYVIAIDGQPTSTFEPLRASLPFAPGTRYDLLVDLAPEAGATGAVTALIGDGLPLLEVRDRRREAPGPARDRSAAAQHEAAGDDQAAERHAARTW